MFYHLSGSPAVCHTRIVSSVFYRHRIEIVSPAELCVKAVYSCYQFDALDERLCQWKFCVLIAFITCSTSCHFGNDWSMECIYVCVGIHWRLLQMGLYSTYDTWQIDTAFFCRLGVCNYNSNACESSRCLCHNWRGTHSVNSPVVTQVRLAAPHWVTAGTTVPAGAAGITAEALNRFQGNPWGICDRQCVCWNTLFLK